MKAGNIDLMVHRRITADDGRGVVEPLLEPGQFGDGLMVRGKHFVFLDFSPKTNFQPYEEKMIQKPQIFIWNKGKKLLIKF